MKEIFKKYKIYYFFFILVAICSCNNEISETEQMKESLTIEKAKEWYESNIQVLANSGLFKARSTDSTYMNLKPLLNWDLAEIDNDSLWSVVELPWEFENGKIELANSEVKSYSEDNQTDIQQILRLVILKNRQTGEMFGFKMAVIPDLEYMLKKGNEINANRYLDRDSELSGTVMFYSLKDEFVNGWRYIDGKITARMIKDELPDTQNNIIGLYKALPNLVVYEVETCYYFYVITGGVKGPTQSNGCVTEYFTEIEYIESGGDASGSSGGGGGGGFSGATPTTPQIQDKINCDPSADANTKKVSDVLNSTFDNGTIAFNMQAVATNIPTLRNHASSSSFEWGMVVNYADGYYFTTMKNNMSITTNFSSTSFEYFTNKYTYMICHSHPKKEAMTSQDILSSPSPSDAVALGSAYNDFSKNIFCNVIFAANGTEYCVYVSDRNAFVDFCTNSANTSFFDKTGSNFKVGSVWASEYKLVFDNLVKQGYSQTDANSFALTSVLYKYNTGIKIASRKNSTDDFKEQSITQLSNGNYQPKRCADTSTINKQIQ